MIRRGNLQIWSLISLSSVMLLVFFALCSPASAVDGDGFIEHLVSWWRFDEGSGTTAYDSAGDNHGTLIGDTNWVPGKIGSYALDFDGNGDYVNLGSPANLDDLPLGDFTVCAWIYDEHSAGTVWGTIIGCYEVNRGWTFRTFSNTDGERSLYFQVSHLIDPANYQSSNGTIRQSAWHHVAAVWDANFKTATLYIDGVEPSYQTATAGEGTYKSDASINKEIGRLPYMGGVQYFNGIIDDVAIFDRALSAWEIQQLYIEGLGNRALNLNPEDEAMSVPVDVVLSWIPGYSVQDVNGHEVYFGTSWSDVNKANSVSRPNVELYIVSDPCCEVGILSFATTYFWRVDEVNEPNVWKGNVWSFTTDNGKARDPDPGDGVIRVNPGLKKLRWTPSPCAVSQDVYFGTDADDVNTSLTADYSGLTGDVGECNIPAGYLPLMFATDYYWRVDTNNGALPATKGYVWSFTTLDLNPIGWWKFDEGNGITAYDSAGSNHGTLIGDMNWVAGRIGSYALDFDGNEDYVGCGDIDEIDGATNITFAAWINTDNIANQKLISRKGEGKTPYCFWIMSDYTINFGIYVASYNYSARTMEAILPNQWFFVTGTYDGETVRTYINGVEKAANTEPSGPIYSNSDSVTIGAGYPMYPTAWFDGTIDDVRIYKRALPAEEIWQLYREGIFKAIVPNPEDEATCVHIDADLSWTAGEYVQDVNGHEVYFGTNWSDVNEANCVSHPNVELYIVSDPCCDVGTLSLDTTYFWRVDEVNEPNVWKGNVWTFKTIYSEGYIYVDDDGPADFNNIQAAIDVACNEDTVIVAPGTYTGDGNRDIDFKGKAITVRSVDPNDPNVVAATIIDCQGTEAEPHRGFNFHNGEDAKSVLEGFTITNGYGGIDGPSVGGAVRCNNSSPTITNCNFSRNRAKSAGGGMFNYESSPIVENCIFNDNYAGNGGGMHNEQDSSPTISNCTFRGNRAESRGGGIHTAFVWDTTVSNCTFIGNRAKSSGGGIYSSLSSLTVINCTFSGNYANYESGGVSGVLIIPRANNCIFWGDIPCEIGGLIVESDVTYSNVQGGYSGEGNIDEEPFFIEPGYWVDANDTNIPVEPSDPNAVWIDGDYHLLPGSPCIDTGDPNSYFGLEPEPDGGRVNMGAYGNTPEATSKGGLVLQSYNIVSRSRVGRTVFEYEFTVTLNNNGDEDVSSVLLELLDASGNVEIIDSEVNFAYIEAGEAATSEDTFSLRVDRASAIDAATISWRATFEYAGGGAGTAAFTNNIMFEDMAGDVSGDGEVDIEDLARLAERWLWIGQEGEIAEDVAPFPDGDGIVNWLDFAEIAGKWGTQ